MDVVHHALADAPKLGLIDAYAHDYLASTPASAMLKVQLSRADFVIEADGVGPILCHAFAYLLAIDVGPWILR